MIDEHDLKIKNKPYEVFTIQNNDSQKEDIQQEEWLKLQWKDVLALLIAVYRIFLPWVLVIFGIYALLLLTFDWIY